MRDNHQQWDYWTLRPESAHQVTWLLGDRGIPKTWRHQDGFGSHTYQFVNAEGKRSWVKFHFKTDQGIEFLTQDEADTLAGTDPDHHRADLFQAIENGVYPSWTFKIQILPEEDAEGYRFNPFDLTKVWSQKDYPLIEVGKLTLNRNPENFHAQIEQASFEPSNLVPGIGASPDKVLLSRIFSYADAHRYRIGSNYAQLPVNRPKSPVHSYQYKDGASQIPWNDPAVPVYAPNSYGGPAADPARADDEEGAWQFDGRAVRAGYIEHSEDSDWAQPGTLVREVLDDAARDRLVGNIVGHVANGVHEPVLSRVYEYWSNVDADLGRRVKEGVEAELGKAVTTTAQTVAEDKATASV